MNWNAKMESTNWLKQSLESPLYPGLLWSRPENRRHAGKLLVIGGNSHAISAPGLAYSAAEKAGIGTCRVLLPVSTKKLVGKIFPEAEFAASTPSGSLAREALAQLLESADWADSVLLAGDFGRNSETAILLEEFAMKYKGQLIISQDGIDYFLTNNSFLLDRENTLSVINFGKLQKLAQKNRPVPPIKFAMDLRQLVETMQLWTQEHKVSFLTNHYEKFLVSADGKVSTTPMPDDSNWQLELSAYAATWWLQQPQKPFDAITTSVYDYSKSHKV
jgi:ADP-dependent NAD(P)H-hydrate dehydratase / NAD(P)H-hydrate epimerase